MFSNSASLELLSCTNENADRIFLHPSFHKNFVCVCKWNWTIYLDFIILTLMKNMYKVSKRILAFCCWHVVVFFFMKILEIFYCLMILNDTILIWKIFHMAFCRNILSIFLLDFILSYMKLFIKYTMYILISNVSKVSFILC